jgi:hypothetical protein
MFFWRNRFSPGYFGRLAGALLLHLLGVCVVFCVVGWWLIPEEAHSAISQAYAQGVFAEQPHEILLHAGISLCGWALLFIGWELFVSGNEARSPRLVKARGTVIVETIIVFPVFLIVLLGLVQLALLNTAGFMTTLGAFKAGRTVAIWYPEALQGRNGVDLALVEEKARLAAASSIAPVAPADYIVVEGQCPASGSLSAKLQALGDFGHGDSPASSFEHGVEENLSLATAFDQSDFSTRGQTKLLFAHCAVDVDFAVGGQEVLTQIQYQHQIAMPVVTLLFGQPSTVGGREGYYAIIERDHRTTYQIEPMIEPPGGSTF